MELLESDVKEFARDVLYVLTYIHDRNIIDCDIKPDNLLLFLVDVRFRSSGYLSRLHIITKVNIVASVYMMKVLVSATTHFFCTNLVVKIILI